MPKDPEAIAVIDQAFEDLLAFLKSKAATGQKAFEKDVNAKLDKEGKKVLGYKKALKYMVESFAQRCGIIMAGIGASNTCTCTCACTRTCACSCTCTPARSASSRSCRRWCAVGRAEMEATWRVHPLQCRVQRVKCTGQKVGMKEDKR